MERVVGFLAWAKEHQGVRVGGGRELCLAGNGARRGSRAEEGEGVREGGTLSGFSKTREGAAGTQRHAAWRWGAVALHGGHAPISANRWWARSSMSWRPFSAYSG